MQTVDDIEFGTIEIHRHSRAKHIKVRITPQGNVRIVTPSFTPQFLVRRIVREQRTVLRAMLLDHRQVLSYEDGSPIGKSHSLHIITDAPRTTVRREKTAVILNIKEGNTLNSHETQAVLRKGIIDALRREARSYLPRRVKVLAEQFGCIYSKIGFSHAAGRWGSCNSEGKIMLNIALMKLPFELIDYVIAHELAHTKELNHSAKFWRLVESFDPHYVQHRALLKQETPAI